MTQPSSQPPWPSARTPGTSSGSTPSRTPRILITAGPTQEPIDQVRYIGNRSSGRLGVALADHAARLGWAVTLLLGPTPLTSSYPSVEVKRFRTTADLQRLLAENFAACDVLIMAAAVADFRPINQSGAAKLRRSAGPIQLDLEPTPDLLAHCGKLRRADQYIVGFALEPEDRLMSSAADKLVRKGADMIVANPLETMDAPTIRATLVRQGRPAVETPGAIAKEAFAGWLLEEITRSLAGPSGGQ